MDICSLVDILKSNRTFNTFTHLHFMSKFQSSGSQRLNLYHKKRIIIILIINYMIFQLADLKVWYDLNCIIFAKNSMDNSCGLYRFCWKFLTLQQQIVLPISDKVYLSASWSDKLLVMENSPPGGHLTSVVFVCGQLLDI